MDAMDPLKALEARIAELEAKNKKLEADNTWLQTMSLFRLPNGPAVAVDSSVTCPPEQRALILGIHERHWQKLKALTGPAQLEYAREFMAIVRSALESRVITVEEAQAWNGKVQAALRDGA